MIYGTTEIPQEHYKKSTFKRVLRFKNYEQCFQVNENRYNFTHIKIAMFLKNVFLRLQRFSHPRKHNIYQCL